MVPQPDKTSVREAKRSTASRHPGVVRGEFDELEATLNGGVHGVVGGAFDARTEHGARLVLGELVKNFVEFGVGAHVRLVTHLLAHRAASAERVTALGDAAETGARARSRRSVRKLARVVSLAREQLAQRRILFNLTAHERVILTRRTRVGGQLRLDDVFDNLARVRDVVNLLRVRRRHDDDTVLITDDRITRSHDDTTARDDTVRLPRLVHVRSLSRRRRD